MCKIKKSTIDFVCNKSYKIPLFACCLIVVIFPQTDSCTEGMPGKIVGMGYF